jgi:hypothetical protein
MLNLSKIIHTGIIKAQKDCISWSGLVLGNSAECLIVTNIAQSIANLKYINDIRCIYVEQSTKELAQWDSLTYKKIRDGRIDICIENSQGYAIIEVKNTLTNKGKKYNSIISDIERIKIFLENENLIKDGYICFLNANFMRYKENTEDNKEVIRSTIKDRLKFFKNDIKTRFPDLKFKFTNKDFLEKTYEDNIWGWQSVVVRIRLY